MQNWKQKTHPTLWALLYGLAWPQYTFYHLCLLLQPVVRSLHSRSKKRLSKNYERIGCLSSGHQYIPSPLQNAKSQQGPVSPCIWAGILQPTWVEDVRSSPLPTSLCLTESSSDQSFSKKKPQVQVSNPTLCMHYLPYKSLMDLEFMKPVVITVLRKTSVSLFIIIPLWQDRSCYLITWWHHHIKTGQI